MALKLTEEAARSTTAVPLRRLGVWLVVVSFVFLQFIEIKFFTLNGVDVTLDKLVALIIFPAAFVLMRQIRVALPLLILAVVMISANSAAYIVNSDLLNPLLLSSNATVLSGFVAATFLYTALTLDESGFDTLGRTWAVLAAATSVLVVGQAMGWLPLWAVSEEALKYRATGVEGVIRGTGLRFDPNFQALVLATGVVFARFYLGRMRNAVTLLILLGIAGTSSRMGLLIAVVVWIMATAVQARSSRGGGGLVLLKVLATTVALAVVAYGAYFLSPWEVQSYIDQRVEQTSELFSSPFSSPSSPGTGRDSTEERIQLVPASLEILSQHYLLGIGASKVPEFLYPVMGTLNVVHNTYLEELLIGGLLMGGLVIALYAAFIARAMVRSRAKGDINVRRSIVMLLFAFSIFGVFLTLNYDTILWLPPVVALAYSRVTHRTLEESTS